MTSTSILGLICFLIIGSAYGAKQIGRNYQFSYASGDSARSEAADEDGQVQGSYTYIADDGSEKTVNYAAGRSGFVAEGEGILNVPQLIANTRSRLAAEGRSYEPTAEELASWANADRSYSLSYHAGDSARSEVSGPDGYVTGQYSYVDRDGVERTVEYEAGAGIGFRVKGEHINKGISDASVRSNFERVPLQLSEYTLRSGLQDTERADVKSSYDADGSYHYSYDSSDHSRSESVGPYGDVQGAYTYIGDDGQEHTVNYVAGAGTGFVVSGDHLRGTAGYSADLSAARQRIAATRGGSAIRSGQSSRTGSRFQSTSSAGGLQGLAGGLGGTSGTVETTRIRTQQGSRRQGISGASQLLAGQRIAGSGLGQAGGRFDVTRTETTRTIPGTSRVITIPGSTNTQQYTTYTTSTGQRNPSLSLISSGLTGATRTSQSQSGSYGALGNLGFHSLATGGRTGVLTTIPGRQVNTVTTKETRRFTRPSGASVNLLNIPYGTRQKQTIRGSTSSSTGSHQQEK